MSENKPRPIVVLLAIGFIVCLIPALGTVWFALHWNPWAVAVCVALVVGFGYGVARIARSQRSEG